eukprot:m.328481 g.328481  ORF g.328481 m.328481 type:complete len:507 (+) comp20429_c0_seq7:295-1815(+)
MYLFRQKNPLTWIAVLYSLTPLVAGGESVRMRERVPPHDHLHGDTAYTDFYDYIVSEFNSLEELLPFIASYLLVAAVVIRIGYWLATYREFLLSVLAAWAMWFMHALFFRGSISLESMAERFIAVQMASSNVLFAAKDLCIAWFDLVLPFYSDLSYTTKALWDTLDTTTKVLIVLAVFFVYGLFKVYIKAREHRHTLKRVAYQASFAIVAPAVWYGSQYVLVGRMLPVTVGLMISIVPAFYSLRSFHASGGQRQRSEERGLWLSYWSCWPMVNYISAVVMHDVSAPSELQRLLLVLLVWLQFWEGSRLFPDLIMKGALYVGLPVWNVATANLPQWVRNPSAFFFQHFSRLSSAYEFAKGNKFLSGGGILVVAYLFWSFVSTMSGLLTVLIWWAASLKTTEVISKKKVDDYKGQLAFWILALGYTQLMMVPVVRYFAAIWEPIFLSVAQSMGESILTYLLKFVLGLYHGVVAPTARARSPVPAPTTTADASAEDEASTPPSTTHVEE